jgi:hypothetical protein
VFLRRSIVDFLNLTALAQKVMALMHFLQERADNSLHLEHVPQRQAEKEDKKCRGELAEVRTIEPKEGLRKEV